jgi:hypothetical protein
LAFCAALKIASDRLHQNLGFYAIQAGSDSASRITHFKAFFRMDRKIVALTFGWWAIFFLGKLIRQ